MLGPRLIPHRTTSGGAGSSPYTARTTQSAGVPVAAQASARDPGILA
jgi:hypothetical protein